MKLSVCYNIYIYNAKTINKPKNHIKTSFKLSQFSQPKTTKMEQTSEGIGIKMYSASKRVDNSSSMYPTNLPQDEIIPELPLPIVGKKRRAMANGVQKTLSKTSLLVNFLPTGTLLTFEMLLPSVFGKGDCSPITTFMILTLLGLCTLSCFFFHFTDSFRGPDGKIYYGFVTPRGLKVFKTGLGVDVPKDER